MRGLRVIGAPRKTKKTAVLEKIEQAHRFTVGGCPGRTPHAPKLDRNQGLRSQVRHSITARQRLWKPSKKVLSPFDTQLKFQVFRDGLQSVFPHRPQSP